MSTNWFKKTVTKLKRFGDKVEKFEDSVLSERDKFKDVFERNLVLEQEIRERTEELNQANQSLLTLKHIWSTMNSSEPLSEVLSTVVNGLGNEMGYLYCAVFQVFESNGKDILRIRAANTSNLDNKIQDALKRVLDLYEIPLTDLENPLTQSINEQKIKNIKNFRNIFTKSFTGIDEDEELNQLEALFIGRSISILPIAVQEKPFGCLLVVSIRNDLSDTERNFLSLFVGQIELAVTIAGLFEQIREQAITDGLTGLYNRRHFDQCLSSEVVRSLRLKQPFTLISLDLDHLKFINDTYGHPAGDLAILHIGKILRENARSVDIAARCGGEEFSIILPGIGTEGGMIAAERLRTAIEIEKVEGIGTVTASIGVATFLTHTDNLTELLELGDQALYRAKRNGRNQVQMAIKEEPENWQVLALEAFLDVLSKRRIPVSSKIVKELTRKLKSSDIHDKSLQDFLYFIVDTLAKTYNPVYQGDYTRKKVSVISQMAKVMDMPDSEVDKLTLAVILHDLGSLMMPENILLKPGPLDEMEMKYIRENPVLTAREILKPIKSASPIINLVENHSEHWDGKGYPGILAGDDIPVGSRILSIANAYFAMISDRPYRKAHDHKEAIKILQDGAGVTWDENLVEIFVTIIQKQSELV
jgi:diguanylate cyclase (GGDEF)-like protein